MCRSGVIARIALTVSIDGDTRFIGGHAGLPLTVIGQGVGGQHDHLTDGEFHIKELFFAQTAASHGHLGGIFS